MKAFMFLAVVAALAISANANIELFKLEARSISPNHGFAYNSLLEDNKCAIQTPITGFQVADQGAAEHDQGAKQWMEKLLELQAQAVEHGYDIKNIKWEESITEILHQLKTQRFNFINGSNKLTRTQTAHIRVYEEVENMGESNTEQSAENLTYVIPSIGSELKDDANSISPELYNNEVHELFKDIHHYLFEAFIIYLTETQPQTFATVKTNFERLAKLEESSPERAGLEKENEQVFAKLDQHLEKVRKENKEATETIDAFEALLGIFTTGEVLTTIDVQFEFKVARLFLFDELHEVTPDFDLFMENLEEAMEAVHQKGPEAANASLIAHNEGAKDGEEVFEYIDDDEKDFDIDCDAFITFYKHNKHDKKLFLNTVKPKSGRHALGAHHQKHSAAHAPHAKKRVATKKGHK